MIQTTFLHLHQSVQELITTAQKKTIWAINQEMIYLYWHIGCEIKTHIVQSERAEYGQEVLKKLSEQLTAEFGKGYGKVNLSYFIRFYETFSDFAIVQTLSEQLSWSHFVTLISLKDTIQRDFYTEICRREHWSVRLLKNRIDSMLYERTMISHKPEELIVQELAQLKLNEEITEDFVFRDPYLFDFLSLKTHFSEKDFESAILSALQDFIIELGSDFAFLARQKKIVFDNEHYFIDLLFFHRSLKRLVVIELKLGKFKPEYAGQMQFYLRWIEKYEMKVGEEKPIGIILCSDKSDEQVKIMGLENIHIAQYLTQLPPKEVLLSKLHQAIAIGRNYVTKLKQDDAK